MRIRRTIGKETVKKNLFALNMGTVVQRVDGYYFFIDYVSYFAIIELKKN